MRILINGFGRVGRALFRILDKPGSPVVAHVNDPLPAEQLAYLLRYDTVMGRFDGVSVQDGQLLVNGRRVSLSHNGKLSAADMNGIDVVVNSSGRNNTRESLEQLLALGARRVVISQPVPAGVADKTILQGVNHDELRDEHRIISAGSCTAHCFTPIVRVLHEQWPLIRGYMMTVHAYTSGQNIVDGGHERDPRRGRAGAANIVPTTTESMLAFDQVQPNLANKLTGMAQRVPVVNGSNVELVLEMQGQATREMINETVRAAATGRYKGIIEYSEDPLVSSDVIGNPHSAVFDSALTHAGNGDISGQTTLARIIAWYDNEWGYANRLAQLIKTM
ncbi:MAG: type I glyceraldehyde-3-phosphate dehydrogenase [Planctomycetes bacterium]|nr:type I glyceraldehyde-3-phosphate dehydrogenase [Planctomycetota bacterium]